MKEGKMRKFADTQPKNRQSDGSKTETTLSSVDTRGSWPINKKLCWMKLISLPIVMNKNLGT